MAHETVNHQDRIVRDPDILVGKPVVKGTNIPVELVLARLAVNLDVDELVRDYPELTRDDVRAVLSYAHDRIHADEEPAAPPSSPMSPQEFYAEITKRPDVSELMRRLAR
jgi:uncharacterized protein (DUF433 family)